MKIKLVIIYIVITLMCLLTSCSDANTEDEIYGKLTSLADEEYSQITVTVATEHLLGTLKNEYQIEYISDSQMDVTYHEEEFSLFEKENGDYILPANGIRYRQGSISVKNGVLTEQHGATAIADVSQIGTPSFSFEESFFSNVSASEGSFSADIDDVKGFFGSSIAGTDFTLEVVYGEKLQTLVIAYVSPKKSNTSIQYRFE